MTDHLITGALTALLILQAVWFTVYVTSAWRSTPFGWVWLLKGGCLAVLWALLLADQIVEVPNAWFAVLGVLLVAATGAWTWVTVKARFGRFAPYL